MILGKADTSQLGGPIRIAKISGQVATFGVLAFISMMAYISISLGLINLFPIPMLDGGHLLLNFIEFINGGPLKKKYLEIAHTFGFFILIINVDKSSFFLVFSFLKHTISCRNLNKRWIY